MELPMCLETYSNKYDVHDVDFLCSVVRVCEYRQDYGICYYCKASGSPIKPLQRCSGCQLVAYCNRVCQKNDRSTHKYVCKEFPVCKGKNALYTTGSWKKHIAGLRERADRLPYSDDSPEPIFNHPRVCHTCHESRPNHLTSCVCDSASFCSIKCVAADKQHKEYCSSYGVSARASYVMSLLSALRALPGLRLLGRDHCPLEDLTTLSVHVVTSSPLFGSAPWEEFMHRLPKLKQLHLVFVMQGKEVMRSFTLNSKLTLLRCDDCEAENRVITYSVQQMQYHMFFSSQEYTEPDAVVIYGNAQEMSLTEADDINSILSYRNMTHSRDTVLVLTDASKDLVRLGVTAVNAARPVDQLALPQINPLREMSFDYDAVFNDKHYFTCLRRKSFERKI